MSLISPGHRSGDARPAGYREVVKRRRTGGPSAMAERRRDMFVVWRARPNHWNETQYSVLAKALRS
jgi:hypothetical protein